MSPVLSVNGNSLSPTLPRLGVLCQLEEVVEEELSCELPPLPPDSSCADSALLLELPWFGRPCFTTCQV